MSKQPGFRFSWELEVSLSSSWEICGVFAMRSSWEEDEQGLCAVAKAFGLRLVMTPFRPSSSSSLPHSKRRLDGDDDDEDEDEIYKQERERKKSGGVGRRVLPRWILASSSSASSNSSRKKKQQAQQQQPSSSSGGGEGGLRMEHSLLCPSSFLPFGGGGGGGASKKKMMVIGVPVWQKILENVIRLKNLSHLIVLSMVNRELYGLVWDNHALMRHLLFRRMTTVSRNPFSFSTMLRTELTDASVDHRAMAHRSPVFRPSPSWTKEGTIPSGKIAPFNEYVHKAVVLSSACWCSLCHTLVASHSELVSISLMRLNLCRLCVVDHLISDKELARRFGVNMWETFPSSSGGQRVVVMRLLREGCYSVRYTSSPKERERISNSPSDFQAGCPRKSEGLTFFWMPHVRRVLDLAKARRFMTEVKPRAQATIGAFVLRAVILHNVRCITNRLKQIRFRLFTERAVRVPFGRLVSNAPVRERVLRHLLLDRRMACIMTPSSSIILQQEGRDSFMSPCRALVCEEVEHLSQSDKHEDMPPKRDAVFLFG